MTAPGFPVRIKSGQKKSARLFLDKKNRNASKEKPAVFLLERRY